MKNLKIYLKTIFAMLILNFVSTQLLAQFTTASATEWNVGSSIYAMSTGNDIMDISNNTYRVNVYDDAGMTNPGFTYRVNYSGNLYTGTIAFGYSAVVDPDVCIITDGTNVYALAAYMETGGTNRYFYEFFHWTNSGGWAFVSGGPSAFAASPFGTAVNVDANDAGDFVIIWDNSSNNIKVITGHMVAGAPAFYNGGSPVSTGATGTMPDVCIFKNGGNNKVYYCYLDNSNTLYVDFDTFSNLSLNTPSHSSFNNYSPTGTFYAPRIACPNSGGSVNDWTVVLHEDISNSFYIRGKTYFNGSFYATTYNDGTGNSPSDITGYPNKYPAVAYDSRPVTALFPNVWVAWTMDNSSGSISGATVTGTYPIAVKCNKQGQLLSSGTYWDVPTSLATNDDMEVVSLAGRYTTPTSNNDKLLATYADLLNTDILFKQITPSTATSFRAENNFSQENDHIAGNSNIFDEVRFKNANHLILEIYDMLGKKVLLCNGNMQELKNKFQSWSVNAVPLAYMAKITSGEETITGKIFIGN